MIALLITGTYIMAGLAHTLSRSWAIGVHRAQAHEGNEGRYCKHWACELMANDTFIIGLCFAFWPVMLPAHWLGRLNLAVMRAPYQRSLPPKNSITDDRDQINRNKL